MERLNKFILLPPSCPRIFVEIRFGWSCPRTLNTAKKCQPISQPFRRRRDNPNIDMSEDALRDTRFEYPSRYSEPYDTLLHANVLCGNFKQAESPPTATVTRSTVDPHEEPETSVKMLDAR